MNTRGTAIIRAATLLLACLSSPAIRAGQWELLPAMAHDVELAVDDSVISIRTTGNDPYLVGRWIGKRTEADRILQIEYFCPDGIQAISAYAGPPFKANVRADLPNLSIAEGWQSYTVDLRESFGGRLLDDTAMLRLDFGTKSGVQLQIRNVHLRPRSEHEIRRLAERERLRDQKRSQAERISQYLAQSFPLRIDAIDVDADTVTLSGRFPNRGADSSAWQLIEYPPDLGIGDQSEPIVVPCKLTRDDGLFTAVVSRWINDRDRLHSAWRIRDGNEYLSPRQYATTIKPSSDDFAATRHTPKTQKGLSGIAPRGPLHELPELGIDAATINLVLPRFLSSTAGANKQRIKAPGPPVYFNANAFSSYDSLINLAREQNIVISAIVLIPRSKQASPVSPLVHPESDGGTYAMPDMTTKRGVAVYGHVLSAIAERYRNTEKSPGGITNWIAHNEVDFHSVWTNMGPQPRELFTETYYRSMRMILGAARAHNPHARVFASLTHHWVVPDDGKWRQLAPREALETLQRYSNLEGDFAWGVAYHPYPQSLFAKVAWTDTNITDDFETPLITMQNLEVLGRFLKQPSMRSSDGSLRPVLLSEQGYHTDSYDDEAQTRQAGSLAYAMKKVRQSPWVESFHYHRWIDHVDEGGLMLGLRTLPTQSDRYGKRKRSWYVYQAIGTEREDEVAKDLPRLSTEY